MKILKRTALLVTVALSFSLLLAGGAMTVSADEPGLMASHEKPAKPFKTGVETFCRYNEIEDSWICYL